MSLELKINSNLKVSLDITRDKVLSNLQEARGQGKIKVNDRDFNAICNLVQASFEQASQGAFKNSESLVNELKREYGN